MVLYKVFAAGIFAPWSHYNMNQLGRKPIIKSTNTGIFAIKFMYSVPGSQVKKFIIIQKSIGAQTIKIRVQAEVRLQRIFSVQFM